MRCSLWPADPAGTEERNDEADGPTGKHQERPCGESSHRRTGSNERDEPRPPDRADGGCGAANRPRTAARPACKQRDAYGRTRVQWGDGVDTAPDAVARDPIDDAEWRSGSAERDSPGHRRADVRG